MRLPQALAAKLNLASGHNTAWYRHPYWHLDTRPAARRRLY